MKINTKMMKAEPENRDVHAADLMPNDRKSLQILEHRANILAKSETPVAENYNMVDYIKFTIGKNEYYGIPYQSAKEVIENFNYTPLPLANDVIAGVTNRRGNLLPILDLAKFFHLSDTSSNKKYNLIVVEAQGITVGILADQIIGSASVDADQLKNNQPYEGIIDPKYIVGLHQGITALLNIETILLDFKTMLNP